MLKSGLSILYVAFSALGFWEFGKENIYAFVLCLCTLIVNRYVPYTVHDVAEKTAF